MTHWNYLIPCFTASLLSLSCVLLIWRNAKSRDFRAAYCLRGAALGLFLPALGFFLISADTLAHAAESKNILKTIFLVLLALLPLIELKFAMSVFKWVGSWWTKIFVLVLILQLALLAGSFSKPGQSLSYFLVAGTVSVVMLLLPLVFLVNAYKHVSSLREKNRVLYLLISVSMMILYLWIDFLPGRLLEVPQIGTLFAALSPMFAGYVVVSRRLLDFKVVLYRSAAMLMISAIIGAGFWGIGYLSRGSIGLGFFFSMVLAFGCLCVMAPISQYLVVWSNRQVAHHYSHFRELLTHLKESIHQWVDPLKLSEQMQRSFLDAFEVSDVYHLPPEHQIMPALQARHGILVLEELQDEIAKAKAFREPTQLWEETVEIMKKKGLDLVAPVRGKEKWYGAFGLRRKTSHKAWTTEEIRNMSEVCDWFGLMIENCETLHELHSQDRVNALNAMAATIARGMRLPINSLLTSARILNSTTGNLTLEQKKYISTICGEVQWLEKFISDFGDYVRPLKPVIVSSDLNHIVRDSVKSFPDVNLTLDLAPRVPECQLDSNLIQRLLSKLIDNAREAIGMKGAVTIATRVVSDKLELSVEDTGIGISPDNIPHIFEPFFSTKTQHAGLGLPLVQSIVEAHGATITVESRQDHGTTFQILFPLLKDALRPVAVSSTSGSPAVPAQLPADIPPPSDKPTARLLRRPEGKTI